MGLRWRGVSDSESESEKVISLVFLGGGCLGDDCLDGLEGLEEYWDSLESLLSESSYSLF